MARDHPDHLRTAVEAAERAGDHLEERFSPSCEPGRNDAAAASRAAEELIVDHLMAAYPDHEIISEESEPSFAVRPRWIIDPLDGAENFGNGLDHYAVSIGFEGTRRPDVGVVYYVPSGTLFTAVRGRGAFADGEEIRIEGASELSDALLVTGFDAPSVKAMNFQQFRALLQETQDVRRTGSAAIELALVAAGAFDVFFERMLDIWDTSAGVLLVTEAGGEVTRIEGPDGISGEMVLASNEAIHRDAVALVSSRVEPRS